jgi:hypothetical protein
MRSLRFEALQERQGSAPTTKGKTGEILPTVPQAAGAACRVFSQSSRGNLRQSNQRNTPFCVRLLLGEMSF